MDLAKAVINIATSNTETVRTLRTELYEFYKKCDDYGIKMSSDFICHSLGTAIFDNILDTLSEEQQRVCLKKINDIAYFGGKISSRAIAYHALGDFVPRLFPGAAEKTRNKEGKYDIRIVSSDEWNAHAFDGKAYSQGLHEFLNERKVNSQEKAA